MPPDDELDPAALQAENARLKAELDQARLVANEERSRADGLDVQVSHAATNAASARLAQATAQENAANDSIAAIDGEIRGLKTLWASLNSEGKFAEAADAQEQLGDAVARRRQAMQAKDYYAGQKTQLAAAPTDPIEQFLAQNQGTYSPEDIEWIRRNPRFARDGNFRNRVVQAHSEALAKGLQQRSPEYFEYLGRRGYMSPEPAPAPSSESGAAPTGYAGGGETDLDGEADAAPQIVIKEADMPQRDTGEAFNRRAEAPQPRAAGPGAMRAAIAASPTRRTINGTGRRTVLTLTPAQRETALAIAPHIFGDDVLKGGEAAILQEYAALDNSPAAERIRQGWIDRRG